MHNWVATKNKEIVKETLLDFKMATIRCDNEKGIDLPFYIYKGEKTVLDNILSEMDKYTLIISNGIKYDSIQLCNVVANMDQNGDFLAEFNSAKVPLRHMYNYPLNSIRGSVFDKPRDIEKLRYADKEVYLKYVLDFLFDMFVKEITNVWIEATLYPIPVGNRNEKYVLWELKQCSYRR